MLFLVAGKEDIEARGGRPPPGDVVRQLQSAVFATEGAWVTVVLEEALDDSFIAVVRRPVHWCHLRAFLAAVGIGTRAQQCLDDVKSVLLGLCCLASCFYTFVRSLLCSTVPS